MSKPRFITICQQAKGLMEKIPNKTGMMQNMIDSFPKASEIFFAEGMYWEIYEYEKKYPQAKSSFDAMKIVLEIHKSLPQEVYDAIACDAFTPSHLFMCGKKAERAIIEHIDVVEAMKDNQVNILQDIMVSISQQREEGFVNVCNSPLTKGERAANKGKIIEFLKETGNKNVINKLIPALNYTTFFTKSHCNGHHNNYDGALAQHSLGVCLNALELAGNAIEREKVILAALLHDICDVNVFYDKDHKQVHAASGHGYRSRDILERLQLGIDKDVLDVIRYHLGTSKRNEKEKRDHSEIWASPLFSVLHVADHMDAGFNHCGDVGLTGAESYISLDCSRLFNLRDFKILRGKIESLARKYNIKLKQKHGYTEWNSKKCSMRLLELGEKPWNDLVPLTDVCRRVSKKTTACDIRLSNFSINKNNLVLAAEPDPSLLTLRDHLQNQIKQSGYETTFTKNLAVNIVKIDNSTGNTDKFLEELNQINVNYMFIVNAINLHYYKGLAAGLYYLCQKKE